MCVCYRYTDRILVRTHGSHSARTRHCILCTLLTEARALCVVQVRTNRSDIAARTLEYTDVVGAHVLTSDHAPVRAYVVLTVPLPALDTSLGLGGVPPLHRSATGGSNLGP